MENQQRHKEHRTVRRCAAALRVPQRRECRPSLSGVEGNAFQRERFRYAVRFGLRGDLYDNLYYGFRLETSSNPRSTWATFGSDNPTTPGAKTDGINIGQVYSGGGLPSWFDITAGKMPIPLYVTPMIWDSDVNPEGAVEKFKVSLGDHVDLFGTFGQFIYQDTDQDHGIPSSDTFLLAWQLGANVKLTKDISLKIAPTLYSYTGQGSVGGPLNDAFTGEGTGVGAANGPGLNSANGVSSGYFNQSGINNLLVLEIPAELNFKVGRTTLGIFGDFAYNFYGDDRARGLCGQQRHGGVANACPTLPPSPARTRPTRSVLASAISAWFTARRQRKTPGKREPTGSMSSSIRARCKPDGLGLLRGPRQPGRESSPPSPTASPTTLSARSVTATPTASTKTWVPAAATPTFPGSTPSETTTSCSWI